MAQPSGQSHLMVKKSKDVSVVEFSDRKILDELAIAEIQDELLNLIKSEPKIKLLLHFGNVEHMTSAALAMLINLDQKVKQNSGKLKLSDINAQIYEVFRITQLNKFFDIHGSAQEALAAF